MPNPNNDPIGYVIDAMWKDLARNGERAVHEMIAALATKDYPLALCMAIAIELQATKDEAGSESRVLEKLASLERYVFNVRNLLETPSLPRPPTPPLPSITTEDVDQWLKPYPKPPPLPKPLSTPPS